MMAPAGLTPPGRPLFRFDKKTPQRLVGLAALLIAAYTLFIILWPLRWSLLATWAVIELIYYVLYWRPRYAELNEQPERHEPKTLDAMKTFQRFLKFCKDLPKGIDYQAYYSGWFRGAPFHDIKRGNAEDFMAYGFWYRSREQMQAAGLGDVPARMVDQLEKTWGIKFEPGFNDKIKFMGHLWEPLNASWRPLLFYICTDLIGWFARQLLRRWGFDHHKHNGLSYFTLNVGRSKAAFQRATSNSALADSTAAAALPGAAAPTIPRSAAAVDHQPQQQQHNGCAGSREQSRFAKEAAQSAGGSKEQADSRSSSRSASPGKSPSRVGSACNLQRAKSSPFEAGPPDWTPFADPETPLPPTVSGELAAAAAAASNGSTASSAATATTGAASSSLGGSSAAPSLGSSAPSSGKHQQVAANVSAVQSAMLAAQAAPMMSGLSMRTSLLLRGAANPLQGALSEGLGSADTPVLFLHGVGGLPAYLEMILHVMGLGHPVIVVEFRGVSMRLGKVFTADEVADTVVGILDKLGVKEACVVGHSYGTFIAGMLARHHRKRVHTLCLIDPVCFGMFMPHLLYNFLYRGPTSRGWSLADTVEYVKDAIRLVASREMHVCATFARGFYWSDLNLWPEDLAPGSVVLLSGKDDLMDAAEVKDMLDVAGHIKVMYNNDLTHGAFLLDYEVKQAIVTEMRGLLARSGSAVVGLARPVLARTLTFMAHGFGVAPSRVSMKKGGGNGRYYVEDHSNQLVRTFTGNLTKMLSQMPNSFRNGVSEGGPARSGSGTGAKGAIAGAGNGIAGRAAAGEWSATRLMQTFSGPVRRRFGARSWAHTDAGGEGSVREQDLPAGSTLLDGKGGSPTAAGAEAAAGLSHKRGSAGAKWEGRPAGMGQPGVSRIDEGEGGEELQ